MALDAPGLLDHWRALVPEGGGSSPFLSWQWAAALAAVPAVSASMQVLLVVQEERVLGLFPVEHWRDRAGLRVLGAAGGQWLGPDHLDVVAAPADRAAVAAAVVGHVGAGSWDLLDLEGLSADGALSAALGRLRAPRFLRLPDREVPGPYVDLRPREPALLLPSRNLRQQVTRGGRAAESAGGGLRVDALPFEVVERLQDLMTLHQQRYAGVSQIFASGDRRQFHVEAARRLAGSGLARIYRLEVEGRDAALLYALKAGDTLHYYSMGIRPELAPSPGRTLLGQCLLSAAQEGLTELDLLRGEHDFKMRFASGVRVDLHVRIMRPTARSLRSIAGRAAARLGDRMRPDGPDQTPHAPPGREG
jgi:CelD/BcsL family acetyltransferase involved in cellulose biosynthesis